MKDQASNVAERPEKVQLLVTCVVDVFAPEVGEATVEVLERLGIVVEFPFDQTCCGQPAFNIGHRSEARRMIAHTLEVLDRTEGPIVAPSGSCVDMIKHHGPDLVADDPQLSAAAGRVAARIREFTAFLVDDLGVTNVGAHANVRAAYHSSCHGLRNLGLTSQAQDLLREVEGLELVELPGGLECCGFGGLFALEMPAVSAAMLTTKLDNIEASGAELIVGGDASCLLHMEGGINRRGASVRLCHVAEILAGRQS